MSTLTKKKAVEPISTFDRNGALVVNAYSLLTSSRALGQIEAARKISEHISKKGSGRKRAG